MASNYPKIWINSKRRTIQQLERFRMDVVEEVADALEVLYKKYHWDEAFLFGSITQKERFGSRSDIDVALSGLNTFDYYAFVGDLSELVNRQVDVILIEECRFSKSIIEKGKKWIPKRR